MKIITHISRKIHRATTQRSRTWLVCLIGLTIFSAATTHALAPYDIPKFQAAIAECKLQAPTSATAATQEELIAGYSSSWFYVADTDKMAFYQTRAGKRTELRYLTNWYVNDVNITAHGNLKIIEQTCDQVTLMQIHDDAAAGDGPNLPLLRIYRHTTKTPVNHLWAAIKVAANGQVTEHVDLGLAPTGYFDCDITVNNGNLTIKIDGATLVNRDVSFWTWPSYWKAGVYLQDKGKATVYFNELTWPGTSSGNPPTVATNPNPADDATGVTTSPTLTWTAGTGATSHDVYFGTDSTPDAGEFQGNQSGASFLPGTLAESTTYYWAIDEVNAYGTTDGPTWSFTTGAGGGDPLPGEAIDPIPAHRERNVPTTVTLSWIAGSDATSHDVYFGTVSGSPIFIGNQTGTSFDPGTLDNKDTYYWRIDEVNDAGTTTGTQWSFTTVR